MTSNSGEVQKYDSFDFRKIVFLTPVKSPDKLYHAAAKTSDTESMIYIQTPSMKVASFGTDPSESKKCFVDLEVDDDAFYQLLRYIDTHIVQHVFKNREAWFKNVEVNMAAVEDCYKSMIQKGPNGPLVKFKLNVTDRIHTQLYVGRDLTDIERLAEDMTVTAIVQLRGLVMNKGSICPDWVVHCLKTPSKKQDKPLFSSVY